MSDLERALRAVGETVPERPLVCMENVAEWSDYALALEPILLRVCERLERAERCMYCDGTGLERLGARSDQDPRPEYDVCSACSGTGKEQ